MRCPRCGNDNPDTNRFCGLCGATLLQTPVAVSQPAQNSAQSSAASSPTAPPPPRPPAAPRAAAPVSEEAPIVSGPSFLGLNRPDPRSRASMTIDPHGSSSGPRNLDYLLDDEDEEEHHGGAGKFIVILLALALAAGLGYLRWRNQGFGWLGALASKRPATAQNTDSTDSTSSAPSSGDSSITPAPAAPAPAAQNGTVAQPAPATTPAPAPSANSPAPAAPANNPPAAGDAGSATNTNNSATSTPAAPATAAPVPAPAKDDAPAADDSSADQPKATPAPAPKPRPAPQPTADSTIDLAKEFIYGTNGVRQDCDRGLKLLKPAAAASNPRAMTELGALYSAGLCTPRDLPTAYRWFALALRKQPDNQAVQTDLQKLWGEMTQPERQLAIKLSQ